MMMISTHWHSTRSRTVGLVHTIFLPHTSWVRKLQISAGTLVNNCYECAATSGQQLPSSDRSLEVNGPRGTFLDVSDSTEAKSSFKYSAVFHLCYQRKVGVQARGGHLTPLVVTQHSGRGKLK